MNQTTETTLITEAQEQSPKRLTLIIFDGTSAAAYMLLNKLNFEDCDVLIPIEVPGDESKVPAITAFFDSIRNKIDEMNLKHSIRNVIFHTATHTKVILSTLPAVDDIRNHFPHKAMFNGIQSALHIADLNYHLIVAAPGCVDDYQDYMPVYGNESKFYSQVSLAWDYLYSCFNEKQDKTITLLFPLAHHQREDIHKKLIAEYGFTVPFTQEEKQDVVQG